MKRREFIHKSAFAAGSLLLPNMANSNSLLLPKSGVDFTKADFGPNFKWGVATSAYQIEGAHLLDGKGPSVWDTFSHTKKKIKDGTNGDVSCDFYHNYPKDLSLLQQMNFDVFRFSTSWARILPEGIGKVNQKGIDFYNKVIDRCLALGIEPWLTLYHWDLPQALEDKKGWANRDVVDWFLEYTKVCTDAFGDRVNNWMVLNEPMAYVALGYMTGDHAPGKKSLGKFMKAIHHTCLVQGEAGRLLKSEMPDANIGSTFSTSPVHPLTDEPKHVKAARKIDALINRLFIEPVLGMGYPVDGLKHLKRIERHMQPGDEEKIKFDFDFIGLQNYSRIVAKKSLTPPFVWANEVKPEDRGVEETTLMGWEVYPEGMYEALKRFSAYENCPPIVVTENGTAFEDIVDNHRVHDEKRVQFFRDYLGQVLKAKNEGVDVRGYYVWTLLDNFEWAEGYIPRFGLLHVDFETQRRRMKDSALWFQSFLMDK